MTITLDEPMSASTRPRVIKRSEIGETFIGALVRKEQRAITKDQEGGGRVEVINPNTGRPRQELVLTLITMPGTTALAALAGEAAVPSPGDVVRMIIKGKQFADWIKETKDFSVSVGDVVGQITDTAISYSAAGTPSKTMFKQAEVDAVPRNTTVGIYGPLTVRQSTGADKEWVELAEAKYHEMANLEAEASKIAIDSPAQSHAYEDEPF